MLRRGKYLSLSGHLQTWIIPVSRLGVERGERRRFRTSLTLRAAADLFGALVVTALRRDVCFQSGNFVPNLRVEDLWWGFLNNFSAPFSSIFSESNVELKHCVPFNNSLLYTYFDELWAFLVFCFYTGNVVFMRASWQIFGTCRVS